MKLERLREQWEASGEQDPLWAILTTPGKQSGGWDVDEFFATGQSEWEGVLSRMAECGIVVGRGRALDFGCGVGRLTRALAGHFDTVDGVDVAGSMIAHAREFNGDPQRVQFHHNEHPDLRGFDDASFDLVLSLIVLQHMEPALMRGYLGEFVRVLRPDGVAVFSVPERYVPPEELPADAWRATLNLAGGPPEFAPGRVVRLELEIGNDSPVPWPALAQIGVGNHWLATDGTVLRFDDGRARIAAALAPGGECQVHLDVMAPDEAGEYLLELDLVQEAIAWFADRGSRPLRLTTVVSGDREAPAASGAGHLSPSPKIEMHAMARGDVIAAIERAGGVTLDEAAVDRCGPAFPSVDYVVARARR